MINLQNLSVGYPGQPEATLKRLVMEISDGQFICLLGRNGAGKSTLLRTLAGLQDPLAGEVWIDRKPIHLMNPVDRASKISVVLTERQFGLGLTVEDVVAMGRQPHTGWSGKLDTADWQYVYSALEQVGASTFAGRYLSDLSDGEKQRVMIARAIAQSPRLMLLDEITAFLDLPGRVAVMMLLKQYAQEHGATVILSSHDLELSMQLADTIWLLDDNGRCFSGTPESLKNSGEIGRVFDTDKVKYSHERGIFQLSAHP